MTVIRQGRENIINVDKIMVGDLVQVKAGMEIPVDAVLIRGSGVTVNESAMTGESDEIKKEPLDLCMHRLNEHLADEKKTGH